MPRKPPSDVPAPGVSLIGEGGVRHHVEGAVRPVVRPPPERAPAPAAPAPQVARPGPNGRFPVKKRGGGRPGQDPLANAIQTGRVRSIDPGASGLDVAEAPIRASSKVGAGISTFVSVDGVEYIINRRDDKGKPRSDNPVRCCLMAIVEMAKGGDPFVVLDAFKVKIQDETGKSIYPVDTGR